MRVMFLLTEAWKKAGCHVVKHHAAWQPLDLVNYEFGSFFIFGKKLLMVWKTMFAMDKYDDSPKTGDVPWLCEIAML